MASRTAPTTYLLPAGGSYFAKLRDTRGIRTSYKITREASSQANKGPPRLETRRSVTRGLSPRWFESNTRHKSFPGYCCENSRALCRRRAAMQTVREPSARSWPALRRILRQHVRDIHLQSRKDRTGEVTKIIELMLGSEARGTYAGSIKT